MTAQGLPAVGTGPRRRAGLALGAAGAVALVASLAVAITIGPADIGVGDV